MRTKACGLLMIVPLLAVCRTVPAQHMNSAEAPCRDKVSTAAIAECFHTAGKTEDAQLNQLYSKIMGNLQMDDRRGLRTAERLWVQLRDATCAAERGLYGRGTASGPAFLACLEEETRLRVKDLSTIYGWRLKK